MGELISDFVLTLNQGTLLTHPTRKFLEACATTQLSASLWHDPIKTLQEARAIAHVATEMGVRLMSLGRAGFFTKQSSSRPSRVNLEVLDTAVALGVPDVVVVAGPSLGDHRAAMNAVRRGMAELLPHAVERGLNLVIEPFHPMFLAERSVVISLRQALNVVTELDTDHAGIAADAYHLWWDPELDAAIVDAHKHLRSIHLSDWLVPTTNLLRGRGAPGDGIIDLTDFLRKVITTGYTGPIEIEVLTDAYRTSDPTTVAMDLRDRTTALLLSAQQPLEADGCAPRPAR